MAQRIPVSAQWISEQLRTMFETYTRNVGYIAKKPWHAGTDVDCWQFVIHAGGREYDVVVIERDD